jgi:chemotaxis response regulator CheB
MMLGLLGCVLSFHCFASSVSELDSKLYVVPGSVYVAPNTYHLC